MLQSRESLLGIIGTGVLRSLASRSFTATNGSTDLATAASTPGSSESNPRPNLRTRLAALRLAPRLIALVWHTQRTLTALMLLLRVVRAFAPVAALWTGKLIIDAVVAISRRGGSHRLLWTYVGLEVLVAVLSEVLARASSLTESLLNDRFTNATNVRIMEHAATLDLEQFEDPTFYDALERARQNASGRIALLTQILGLGQSAITLVSLGSALVAQAVWLLPLLVIAVSPGFLAETHFAGLSYTMMFKRTAERRELDYLCYVGASEKTAKEVQLLDLSSWLIARYRALSERFIAENRDLAVRRARVGSGLALVATAGYYAAYVAILARAATGEISIGMLTFLAGSFRQSRDLIQGMLTSTSGIYEQTLYLKDLFTFFDSRASIVSPPNAIVVRARIRDGFTFEDVGFQYPGSSRWAVRNLSFSIRPGERIALVGENGAGKTTITKLLTRLYDPTEGRVLLDGRDLRSYDVRSVRRAVGVVFQDFMRYDMRFDENIAVGDLEAMRGYLDSLADSSGRVAHDDPSPAIVAALEKSQATTLLARLPMRHRQMLGRRFAGGVELSGGEWQKVALARAYMRNAQLMILDEPTSALDARAEYEIFQRFNDLMEGRMAILISHRFSTVRMADRIIVLDQGRIVENGTHDQLAAADGLYGELFSMQAAGYQ